MGKATTGFSGDQEYLDAEANWLRARVRHIISERDARDARERECDDPAPARPRQTSREARLQSVALKEREEHARQEIDSRLKLNRKGKTAPLAIDSACDKHGFGSEERTILIAVTLAAISQPFGEYIISGLTTFYNGVSVSDCCQILGAKSASDWLRLRGLFAANSKLVRSGLIEISSSDKSESPSTLPSSEVRLTMDAFAAFTGTAQAGGES